MRALAATALTLAFIAMAAITYIAVKGDPMGGEPRLVVRILPPAPGMTQSSAAPAGSAAPQIVDAPAPAAVSSATAAPADQPPQPTAAASDASAVGTAPGEDIAGISVTSPN